MTPIDEAHADAIVEDARRSKVKADRALTEALVRGDLLEAQLEQLRAHHREASRARDSYRRETETLRADRSAALARAEKAERDRDEARRETTGAEEEATRQRERAKQAERDRDEARRERDAERARIAAASNQIEEYGCSCDLQPTGFMCEVCGIRDALSGAPAPREG